MGIIAIASYHPKVGQKAAFRTLLDLHHRLLREQGLLSARPPYLMRSLNGTFIDVFEWHSETAKAQAHGNPSIMACWLQFSALADMVPLAALEEAQAPFASFAAI